MSKQITIYTTNNCAYCLMVKKYLSSKGHNYDEINLDDDPRRRQEAIQLSGAMTVPVTVVKSNDGVQNITVGYNPGKLASALS